MRFTRSPTNAMGGENRGEEQRCRDGKALPASFERQSSVVFCLL